MYLPTASMPVPASIDDPRSNSPYRNKATDPAYRDPNKLRYMISDYYGLVTEVDDWVGRILQRLDELGLTDNTLVVFTTVTARCSANTACIRKLFSTRAPSRFRS